MSLDFKVDYKLEGEWSQTFATLTTSSCWQLNNLEAELQGGPTNGATDS